jgi:pimeloyl-ACP methyl ester carboxylesterase
MAGRLPPFPDENGRVLKDSVSERIHVTINGVGQGMFIRGKNILNPVLLFLHGGPGMPEYFLAEKTETGLEDAFTVCWWEQRDAGISYSRGINGTDITTRLLVEDTIAVTNYLRQRFGQEKIYLLGHSWGTYLGIQAAAQAPELYSAYIGMAQIVDTAESEKEAYSYMLGQYRAAGAKRMVKKLESYPIQDSASALKPYFISMLRDTATHRLGVGTTHAMKSVVTGIFLPVMESRAYTLREKINIWRAKAYLRRDTVLLDELFSADLSVKVPRLELPVYFMSGGYDHTVSQSLAARYFDALQAPVKGFYAFSGSAHSPLFEEPGKFMKIMRTDVLNGGAGLADMT